MNQITIPVASEVITDRLPAQAFKKESFRGECPCSQISHKSGSIFLRRWLSLSGPLAHTLRWLTLSAGSHSPLALAHRIEAIGTANYKSLHKAIRMILFGCAVEP